MHLPISLNLLNIKQKVVLRTNSLPSLIRHGPHGKQHVQQLFHSERKKIKQAKKPSPPLRTSEGTWAKSNGEKAHAFAEHLAKVFQPYPSENQPEDKEVLMQLLETRYQLEQPIYSLNRAEVQEVINSLNPKKSSGYDLITGKILEDLLITGIKYLTQLFNAVLLKGYFPA
jgi:hypothetical protein